MLLVDPTGITRVDLEVVIKYAATIVMLPSTGAALTFSRCNKLFRIPQTEYVFSFSYWALICTSG
jgi:hypothetical protein